MSERLPALRPELDIMPSPVAERPGLLLRDPFQYSDAVIIVPPLLARGLAFFDGEHTNLDLREYLARASGEIQTEALARNLIDTLDESGFLESDVYFTLRERKQAEFAEAPERAPVHAGSAYPDDPAALGEQLRDWGAAPAGKSADADGLIAIAAPHVSPEGGYRSYAAAYGRLRPEHAAKTFIILGTSHYGEPERFGLTRKPYRTPLGVLETDQKIVDRLAAQAPDAVKMEDYCHASEHSIEFQCVYLQHVLGAALPAGERLRAVPILCGPLVESLISGKAPESNERAARFFDALAELSAERGDDLIFVLGIDLAHIGRRYGDEFDARSEQGRMSEVRERDGKRLERVVAGDAEGFFELVKGNCDDLRWCGYSAVYTFLKSVTGFAGRVLSYEQWNIDEQSVVSFTGAEFVRRSASSWSRSARENAPR